MAEAQAWGLDLGAPGKPPQVLLGWKMEKAAWGGGCTVVIKLALRTLSLSPSNGLPQDGNLSLLLALRQGPEPSLGPL